MYLDHRRYWNRLSKRRLAVAASDHPIPLPDDETQVGAFLEHISKRARNTHDPDAASSVGRRIAQNVVTNLLAARYLVQVHGEVYAAHNSFTRLFRPPYHLVEGSFVTRGLAPHAEWELFDAAGSIRTFDLRRFSCVPADPFEDERVRAHYLEALSLVLLQDTNDPLMLAFASQTASHVVNSHSRFKALLPELRKVLIERTLSKYVENPPDYLIRQPEPQLDHVFRKFRWRLLDIAKNECESLQHEPSQQHELRAATDEDNCAPEAGDPGAAQRVSITPGRTRRYRRQHGLPPDGLEKAGFCTRSHAARLLTAELGWPVRVTTLTRLEPQAGIIPTRHGRLSWYSHQDYQRLLEVLRARRFSPAQALRMLRNEFDIDGGSRVEVEAGPEAMALRLRVIEDEAPMSCGSGAEDLL